MGAVLRPDPRVAASLTVNTRVRSSGAVARGARLPGLASAASALTGSGSTPETAGTARTSNTAVTAVAAAVQNGVALVPLIAPPSVSTVPRLVVAVTTSNRARGALVVDTAFPPLNYSLL